MKRILLCITTVIFIASASIAAGGAKDNEYAQGKTIYQQNCQMCHGANGKGDGPLAATLMNMPANLTSPKILKNDPKKLIENTIKLGYRTMPPIDLSEDQISEVIDYILNTF